MKKSEIMQIGTKALLQALGPMGMARYLEEYDGSGSGDYTVEKYQKRELGIDETLQTKIAVLFS